MNDLELRQAILAERQEIDPKTRRPVTFEKIAGKRVSSALIWKIANIEGYIVKEDEARIALGMPPLKRVPANLETYDPATEATYTPATHALTPLAKPAVKGSAPKVSKPRYRIAISKKNMQSAHDTITHNIAVWRIRELHTLLTEYLEWADPENDPRPPFPAPTVARAGMGLDV